MKKRYLLTGLLAGLLVAGTVACAGTDEPKDTSTAPTIEPTLEPVLLNSIALEGGKKVFAPGDAFDKGDLKVIGTYSDESTKDLTSTAKLEVLNAAGEKVEKLELLGEYTVNVTALDKKASYKVNCVANINSVADAVKLGASRQGYVIGGVYDDSTIAKSYSFGKDFFRSAYENELVNFDTGETVLVTSEEYYTMRNDEPFLFRQNVDKTTSKVVSYENISADLLNDKGLAASPNLLNYVQTLYGPEEVLAALYQLAKGEFKPADLIDDPDTTPYKAQDLKEELVGAKAANGLHEGYKFTFGAEINGLFLTYSVEFKLADSTLNIESLKVLQNVYTDLTADENGKYTIPEGQESDYSFDLAWSQDAGSRNEEMPVKLDTLLFESFDLMNGDKKITNGEELEISVTGDPILLDIANVKPATASVELDQIVVSPAFGVYASVYYDTFSGKISVSGIEATGKNPLTNEDLYEEFTISTANVSYKIKVKVKASIPTSFDVKAYELIDEGLADDPDDDYWDWTAYTKLQIKPNTELMLKAAFEYGYDATHTAALEEGTTGATLTEGVYTPDFGPEEKMYTFKATELGVYTVTFTSLSAPDVTSKIVITVSNEEPAPAIKLPYNLQKTYEDELGNTLVVNEMDLQWNLETFELTGYVEDTSIEATLGDVVLAITINSDGSLTLVTNDQTYTLKEKIEFNELYWVGTFVAGQDELVISYADGIATITLKGVALEVTGWDEDNIYCNDNGAPLTLTFNAAQNFEIAGVEYVYQA